MTIETSATRLDEHSFNVNSTNDVFLIHYNIVLDGGVSNKQITSTLGISTSSNALATNSVNLYDLSNSVVLTGHNTDGYIGASSTNAGDCVNIAGHATANNLSVGTHYISIWIAANASSTLTRPKCNIVILQIK
jgi:hypothetical protein